MKIFTDTSFLIIRPLLGKVFTLRDSATYCVLFLVLVLINTEDSRSFRYQRVYNFVCN